MFTSSTARKWRLTVLGVPLLLLATMAAPASAELYGFSAISNNSGVSSDVAKQLSVEVTHYGVTDFGVHQVLFTAKNNVGPYQVATPVGSTVFGVFFEDGALLEIAQILEQPEAVNFIEKPEGVFPEGENLFPPFITTKEFTVVKDGAASRGLDPGESVGILFNLKTGKTFADVIDSINLGFTHPSPGESLRIGLHVGRLGLDEEFSDSFVMVPVPGALLLGSLGLGYAGMKLRRKCA